MSGRDGVRQVIEKNHWNLRERKERERERERKREREREREKKKRKNVCSEEKNKHAGIYKEIYEARMSDKNRNLVKASLKKNWLHKIYEKKERYL